MQDKHFKWELVRLMYAQMGVTLMDDIYLRDYSKAFKGHNDGDIPQSYVDAYFKMLRKAKKETQYQQVPGTSFQLGKDENGRVTLKGPGAFGGYEFSPDEWTAFLRVAMSLQAGADPLTTAGYGGVSHAPVDDRPEIKARQERNLKALEDWALASSRHFPGHK